MTAVPAKSKTVTVTISNKHLAAEIAETFEIPKKNAIAMVDGLVGDIVGHMKKGARVRINGLGMFQVRKRAARVGRNPQTGEAIQIKVKKVAAFRASKDLKAAVV